MINMRTFRLLGIVLAVSSVCSGGVLAANPKASSFYEDALKRFETQDTAGAVIQLKNAIQQDRSMLAAQVLLGKALLLEGDPIGAEVAFDEALSQGVDRSEVILLLGQAYLLQGKFDVLISRLVTSGLSSGLKRDVLLMRATAYIEKGNVTLAERALDEARALDPQSARVRAAQGSLMLRLGRVADASRLSAEALALGPTDSSAAELKASLLHVQGDVNGALAAYAQVIRLSPRNVDARIAQAGLLLDLGRADEASAEVVEILRIFPNDPRGNYLKAMVASRKGDMATVQESLKKVVNLLDPVPPSVLGANKQLLLLLPLAHHGLGSLEKADALLMDYLRRFPGEVGAAKLLASINLQRGQASKVISLLEPFRLKHPQDPRLLSLLAAAYMSERRYGQASRLLEDSLKLSGGSADVRADLGLSLLGDGRSDAGLEQLRQAFAKDPSQTRAGVALAALLMRRGEAAKALLVAESLAKSQPKEVAVLNLLGGIKGASGDLAGARQAYERALQVAPVNVPTNLNLARLDTMEGKTDAARGRLNTLLKVSDKNTDAMIEYANLEEAAGNFVESAKWLERARAFPVGALRAGLQLIDLYLKQRSFDKALVVARDLQLKASGNLTVLAALTRVQLAMGDLTEARKTLAEMTRLANFDAGTQVMIAGMQRAAGNDSGAMYSLEKALGGTPGYLPAQLMMAEIEISQKDFAKAETRIKSLAPQQSDTVSVLRLQGELQMARGQYVAAIATFRALLGKKGAEGVVLRLYKAYELSGARAQGMKMLEDWSRLHPDDLLALRALGDACLSSGDLPAAKVAYNKLLAARPDDALVLNNLAQVLLRQGDKSALVVAERAYKISSRDPVVIDTLGWVLVSQAQIDRGLGYLRDARLRDPENREIRFHLAFALDKSGRKQEAREELAGALKDGVHFSGIEEARKLQQVLAK
jgi:putative PEP-CTERM system TPR-repeat lipoprotein